MREGIGIEDYWRAFYELCGAVREYANRLREGRNGSSEYYRLSLATFEKLNQTARRIGLPMVGDGEEDPEKRKKLVERETSLFLNRLFDDQTREACMAEAEKLSEKEKVVSISDLQLRALARLNSKGKHKKDAESISKEVKKAKKVEEKAEQKAERKAEKVEQKAKRKAEKAWQKAANA